MKGSKVRNKAKQSNKIKYNEKRCIIMYESFSEEILTVEEFADLLYIGRNTAYKILNSGEIRAFKIGKSWKIPKDAVSEYILRKSRKNLSDN